jgi:hypothetical protein
MAMSDEDMMIARGFIGAAAASIQDQFADKYDHNDILSIILASLLGLAHHLAIKSVEMSEEEFVEMVLYCSGITKQ